MKISLKQAFSILDSCSGVIFDPEGISIVCEPTIYDLEDEPQHEFLEIPFAVGNGQYDSVYFEEGQNQEVEFSKGQLTLTSISGRQFNLTILIPISLEEANAILDSNI